MSSCGGKDRGNVPRRLAVLPRNRVIRWPRKWPAHLTRSSVTLTRCVEICLKSRRTSGPHGLMVSTHFFGIFPHVASHTSDLPCDHGIRLMPSGLLPASLMRPGGSSVAGTLTVTRALWMSPFTAAWRDMWPAL